MKIFFDTSAFIAMTDKGDRNNAAATAFYASLTSNDRLLTSNFIIDETVTRLRYKAGYDMAVNYAETMLKSRLYSIIRVDAETEGAAMWFLRKFRDKKLSFTDCTTMALLRSRALDAVFSFDDDFARAGFRAVPR